jgi:hypothetical protein
VKGHVVVSGARIPVTEITLRGGSLHLECTARGPLPASDGTCAVTVFGEDGTGVGQGYCDVTWEEVGACDTLALSIAMTFERCYGDAENADGVV